MKIQKKNGQGVYLQMRNNRWKWMAGATAASAAGMTASQAGAITISLVNNYISGGGGNHLNADLTGDGHPDLVIANAFNSYMLAQDSYHYSFRAEVILNGVQAYARFDSNTFNVFMRLGSRSVGGVYYYPPLTGSIPIFFKDLHINGGTPTKGLLEVTVTSRAAINLDSLSYASTTTLDHRVNTIPDQGSSLALLAMGAGGILGLRRWRGRWRAAQAGS